MVQLGDSYLGLQNWKLWFDLPILFCHLYNKWTLSKFSEQSLYFRKDENV